MTPPELDRFSTVELCRVIMSKMDGFMLSVEDALKGVTAEESCAALRDAARYAAGVRRIAGELARRSGKVDCRTHIEKVNDTQWLGKRTGGKVSKP